MSQKNMKKKRDVRGTGKVDFSRQNKINKPPVKLVGLTQATEVASTINYTYGRF